MTDEAVPEAPPPDRRPDRRRALLSIGIAAAVAVVVFGVIFPQLVDWDVVFDTLAEIDATDLVVIVALAVLRYVPGGAIYSVVMPGLSIRQGTEAWVATTAVASTVPGGVDLALRVSMYASWGFPLELAMTGMFLSGLVEMSTKVTLAIAAVTLGSLLTLDLGLFAVAAIASLVLIVVAAVVVAVLRSEARARQFGALVERVVRWVFDRFERQAPPDLVERVLGARRQAREVLGHRWPAAFLTAVTSQAIVFAILLLSLRAVGVDSSILGWSEILLVQGLAIILTSVPITPGSVGIAEIVYVGLLTAFAGSAYSDLLTAGVILFRLAVWLLPIPIGWLVTLRWQSKTGQQLFGAPTTPQA